MSVYKISDVKFKITPQSGYLKNLLEPYLAPGSGFDREISPTEAEIKAENTDGKFPFGVCESTAVLRKVSAELSGGFDSFLIHSAAIEYNGRALLFSAPSGTGKTTHILLWKEMFGEAVKIINGDKPFVRLKNDKFTVYGSPWNGKENFGFNTSAEAAALFFIKRSESCSAERLSAARALPLLLSQIPKAETAAGVQRLLSFLDSLLKRVPVFELRCNISADAVRTAQACIGGV